MPLRGGEGVGCLMANAILNFHFDFPHPSLSRILDQASFLHLLRLSIFNQSLKLRQNAHKQLYTYICWKQKRKIGSHMFKNIVSWRSFGWWLSSSRFNIQQDQAQEGLQFFSVSLPSLPSSEINLFFSFNFSVSGNCLTVSQLPKQGNLTKYVQIHIVS